MNINQFIAKDKNLLFIYMSLATFKKKSVTKSLGTKRSGKPPGGYWLLQGPFGHNTVAQKAANTNFGPEGFSINGPHRNIGGVGRDMKMSKSGTPYRGQHPIGWGGRYGKYPSAILVANQEEQSGAIKNYGNQQAVVQPLLNSQKPDTLGTQYLYIKQSVLSTRGMLRKRYKWVYNGQFPNYWVQPIYNSSAQSQTASQGMYLHNKKATNTRYINVNDSDKYIGYKSCGGPTGCGTSTARYTYNLMAQNAPYTKELSEPIQSSEYTTYIQRGCVNPIGKQKPFPYATQTGKATSAAGTSIRSFSSGCNTSNNFTEPPEWYTNSSNTNSSNTNQYKGSESGC